MRVNFRILLICLFIPVFLYASVFSSMGLGEYVNFGDAVERGMAGAKMFQTPEVHTFKVTSLADFVRIKDENNIRDGHSFYLYDIGYFLPLPNRFGIALSLSNILSRNFHIESKDNKLGDISYDRIIKGSGGIYITSASLYKTFNTFSIDIGGLIPFGGTEEIYEAIFTSGDYNNTIHTVNSATSGYGLRTQFKFGFDRMDIALSYSHFLGSIELPPQSFISLFYRVNQDWTIATSIDLGLWKYVDESFSTATNIGLAASNTKGPFTFRGGVFSRSWYYRNIKEIGGCVGTSFLYPDRLGELSIGIEAGRKSWKEIEELFVRLSVTLCGREIW